MLKSVFTSQFRKDYKLCQKRGYNMQNLIDIMLELEAEKTLQANQREHSLSGNYAGYLECHIKPDWLLIYEINQQTKEIYFVRTGTHSDLFS